MTWKLLEKNFEIGLIVSYEDEKKGEFKTKDGVKFDLHYGNVMNLKSPGSSDYISAIIPAGYYNSPYHLARVMRDKLIAARSSLLNTMLDVELDPVDKQITFTTSGSTASLILYKETRDIAEIFGFPPVTADFKLYGLVRKRKEGEQYKMTFLEDEAR